MPYFSSQPTGYWDRMGVLVNCFVVWGKLHASPKERHRPLCQAPGHKNPLPAWPDSLPVVWREKGQCQPWPWAVFIGFMLLVLRPTSLYAFKQVSKRLTNKLRLRLVSKRPSPGSSRPWIRNRTRIRKPLLPASTATPPECAVSDLRRSPFL